jgi:hypothetical protein
MNHNFKIGNKFYYNFNNGSILMTITDFRLNGFGVIRKIILVDTMGQNYFMTPIQYTKWVTSGKIMECRTMLHPIKHIKKLTLI